MSLVGNRFTLEKIEKAFERLWRSLDDLIPFLKIEFGCAPDQVRAKNPEYYFDPLDIKSMTSFDGMLRATRRAGHSRVNSSIMVSILNALPFSVLHFTKS